MRAERDPQAVGRPGRGLRPRGPAGRAGAAAKEMVTPMLGLRSRRPQAEQELPAESLADLVRARIAAADLLTAAAGGAAGRGGTQSAAPRLGGIGRVPAALAGPVPPRRGAARRGAGRAPPPPPPRVLRGSTAQVQGL